MSVPHQSRIALAALVVSLVAATDLHAQAAADPQMAEAVDVVRSCVALVERRQIPEAEVLGRRAQAQLVSRLKVQPRDVEALVTLARAESQCILPSADMMTQGELSTHAIELLESALEIDPKHWIARYTLASINFRSPAFLGRAPRAAKEFDELLRQQGDRTENPRFARVFEYRGVLFARAGQADSARSLFERGARLFPADTTLRGLAERSASAPKPASLEAKTPPTAAASTPATLGAVRVIASRAPATAGTGAVQQIGKSQVLMTAGGAADVMQSVQMLPGATHVTEGSDIYTRGGDASETSLLVNGGRLSTLSRFEGLSGGMFGAIEPFVVRSVRYSSGGFSAKYGNALSGVIEIETDGRPRERQLRAGLSLVQASGTARVPFSKTLGGWVSARASQTQALLATHGRSAEFQGAPQSIEGIASLISTPSPTNELSATAIVEQDDSKPIINAAGWEGSLPRPRRNRRGRAVIAVDRAERSGDDSHECRREHALERLGLRHPGACARRAEHHHSRRCGVVARRRNHGSRRAGAGKLHTHGEWRPSNDEQRCAGLAAAHRRRRRNRGEPARRVCRDAALA